MTPSSDVEPFDDTRIGPRHDLGLELGAFRVVFSIHVASPGHVNLEEARALVRYVKWILRSSKRCGHRLVILVDSKVVIGAVTKGRSSSTPLNALVRRLAALTFAGGLVLHFIFVPSAHNPSDWPSRGGPASWPAALKRGPPKPSAVSRHLASRWLNMQVGSAILADSDCQSTSESFLDSSDLSSIKSHVRHGRTAKASARLSVAIRKQARSLARHSSA